MRKKTIVVVMNCQGHEIIRYLESSPSIRCQYECVYIANMVSADDAETKRHIMATLATADVLIAQNVYNVEWLRNDHLASYVPKHCRFFRLSFWRFWGYWPLPAERFHPQLWYVADEIAGASTFQDYISAAVPRSSIVSTFEQQVEKLSFIERASELKMMPFVLENYQTHNLFTDEWHPTPIFFLKVCRYILVELGLTPDISLLANDGIDNFRNRFILDAIYDELGLTHERTLLPYYDVQIERETFYDYCQFAARHYDRAVGWEQPKRDFRDWSVSQGLSPKAYDVAPLGRASQSSRSEWSRENDPQRAVSGEVTEDFAFHTGLDHAPWWSIDLREFRKISSIAIWNRERDAGKALPMAVLVSNDGADWHEVAVINGRLSASEGAAPLVLDFPDPVIARHVKLQVRRSSQLHLRKVSVTSEVVARQ